jgi:hypothetical protein
MRGILCVMLLVGLADARAQEPPLGRYRSLRSSVGRRVDELDLPRFQRRTSHIGQEFRSKHFVVVSGFGADHAKDVAVELEAVWEDAGRLADHWMDEHRDPRFGIGAVGVLIDHRPRLEQPTTAGPRPTNFDANIYVSVASDETFGGIQLDGLRRESVKALFRVAKIDQVVPAWAQNGLAAYVARRREQQGPGEQPLATAAFDSVSGASQVANFRRTTADRLPQPPAGDDADAAWAEFLLEGEDGQHAGELLSFISDAVKAAVRQPLPTAAVGPGDEYLRREGDMAWRPEAVMSGGAVMSSSTAGGADARRRFQHWLADPLVGQPVVRWPEGENVSAEEARVAREMVVALKLIERFGEREPARGQPRVVQPTVVYGRAAGDGATVRPAVNEFGVVDAKTNTVATRELTAEGNSVISPALVRAERPLVNLDRLAERLGDPLAAEWATIDAGGELLLWTDRQRVEKLAARLANDYRIVRRDEGYRLEGRSPSGRAVEVWLEPNRDQPRRPVARVEFSRR